MKQRDIQYHLTEILKEMGIKEKAIIEKASFYKDLGLDSLDFAEMIMVFENRFNIEIPMLEAEQIQTVKQATHYLENKFWLKNNC